MALSSVFTRCQRKYRNIRGPSPVDFASSRVNSASSRGCWASPRVNLASSGPSFGDYRGCPGSFAMIRGSSRISVHPREDPLHPRGCPWILANIRGHPRMSFWNPRGCAKCPISGHKHPCESPKSIRKAVFDVRESSGDILEGPNDPSEDAKLIREDATDIREDPRILGDVRGSSRMSGDPRECPWILGDVRGSSLMSGDPRECPGILANVRYGS